MDVNTLQKMTLGRIGSSKGGTWKQQTWPVSLDSFTKDVARHAGGVSAFCHFFATEQAPIPPSIPDP